MEHRLPQPSPSSTVEIGTTAQSDLLALYLQRFDRKHTQSAYRNDLVDFFGAEYITLGMARDVTFIDVNQYLADLEARHFKAATLKRRVAAIRGFFEWLLALEVVERNPANRQLLRRIRSTRQRDRTVFYLTADQAGRLVEAADDGSKAALRDRVLLLTLLYCLLRRSEVAAMDAEHIRSIGHYWVLNLPHTKGGADQYVKIPAHVVEEIDHMRAHYGIDSGPLWRSMSNNNRGRRLKPQSIYYIVKRTAERANLSEEIGAHTLRHTGCTLALEAGASLQQVQSHARHKHVETTMVYLHQSDKLRDSAADFIHIRSPRKPDSKPPIKPIED